MDLLDLMNKASLTPSEQYTYNTLLKQVTQAGIKITQNTIDIELLKPAKLGFKGSRKFKKLHNKLYSSKGLPEEYKEIQQTINSLKQKIKSIPEGDPNLEAELRQAESTRRRYIKRNTPKYIRETVEDKINKQTETRINNLEDKKELAKDKKALLNSKEDEEFENVSEKIHQLKEPWYNAAHKQHKRPSEIIKTPTKKINNKNFNNYNKTIRNEVNHMKYSIFEGADTSKMDDVTEFYTDTSQYFNKYVNLKNSGATRQELDEIIDLEWEKEIWNTAEGTFKTNIKNKYRNIQTKQQLKELFEEMHTRMLQKAEPIPENTITFSVQNLEHYDDLDVGDLLPDTGFISSSLSKEETIKFAQIQYRNDHDIALIEFCIEEDVDVVKILQSAIEKYRNEREIVTIPGYEMKILERYSDVLENEFRGYDVEHFVVQVKKKRS